MKEKTNPSFSLKSRTIKGCKTVVSKLGKESKPFLLEGVTGSGKTEVYLQIIQEVLNKGKTAIMLVPEISPDATDDGSFYFPFWSGSSHSTLGLIKW